MHLDDERGQRLLHRELPAPDLAEAEAHLRECEACRAAFERLAREEARIFGALRHLDQPGRPVSAATIAAAAISAAPPDRPDSRAWPTRAAAAVLMAALAGAAYAIPGSPVRIWIDRLVATPTNPPAPVPPTAPPQVPMGGVAVAPGPRLEVVFGGPIAAAQMIVRLTPGSDLAIRAPADAATYSADGTRLGVELLAPSVTLEVDIPLTARRVEFHSNGRLLFVKDGAAVIQGAESLIGTGPFVVRLGGRL